MEYFDEGDKCPDSKCLGNLHFPKVEGCSCHISPPCGACENNDLECDYCFKPIEELISENS